MRAILILALAVIASPSWGSDQKAAPATPKPTAEQLQSQLDAANASLRTWRKLSEILEERLNAANHDLSVAMMTITIQREDSIAPKSSK